MLSGNEISKKLIYPPISDYALLSDCHSAALVSRQGSIDWCCLYRFDSMPVFSRLLDWNRGGYFQVAPASAYTVERSYYSGTNVLETFFSTEHGRVRLTDCLPVRRSQPEGAGTVRPRPYHQIIRRIECLDGEVDMEISFEPRFDFGLTSPRLDAISDVQALVFGGADALIFQSEIPIAAYDERQCICRKRMMAGEACRVVVSYSKPHELTPRLLSIPEIDRRLEITVDFWTEWTKRCTYKGTFYEPVIRSALVLKALTNAPTGAIVAAPTTSLPEQIGGVRNWDYRYTWLRDSVWMLEALFSLGYREEADAFRRFLWRTTAGRVNELQIMYGIGGERLLPELDLDSLDGYRGSRPVRIGNAAYRQFQLDIPGEMLDLAWHHHLNGGKINEGFWVFLCDIVRYVEENWEKPDSGLWEARAEPRHYVQSKVMCWVAVDRILRLGRALAKDGPYTEWERLRTNIRQRIESEGVDPRSGAFVQAFGSTDLDASCLLIPLVGFVSADDPRARATVDQVEQRLLVNGMVKRYLADDGLPGTEGTFIICTFWLVENYAHMGRIDEARSLFEQTVAFANDLGLLAEEADPLTGELLGNFPQGFSHLGLITAATAIEHALKQKAPSDERSDTSRQAIDHLGPKDSELAAKPERAG